MRELLAALPAVNASLNGLSAILLILGWRTVLKREREKHRRLMLAACASSALFLVSYLVKTVFHGTTTYGGTGFDRTVYLFVLFSHLTLAIAVVPLALVTLVRGLQARFDKHRRIARWTLPIWLYVSVTGVVVYLMLRPWYGLS